jgi:hypothetical protein
MSKIVDQKWALLPWSLRFNCNRQWLKKSEGESDVSERRFRQSCVGDVRTKVCKTPRDLAQTRIYTTTHGLLRLPKSDGFQPANFGGLIPTESWSFSSPFRLRPGSLADKNAEKKDRCEREGLDICSSEHMRDDTCPELKRSQVILLRAWEPLQKLRKIIEVFVLEPVAPADGSIL